MKTRSRPGFLFLHGFPREGRRTSRGPRGRTPRMGWRDPRTVPRGSRGWQSEVRVPAGAVPGRRFLRGHGRLSPCCHRAFSWAVASVPTVKGDTDRRAQSPLRSAARIATASLCPAWRGPRSGGGSTPAEDTQVETQSCGGGLGVAWWPRAVSPESRCLWVAGRLAAPLPLPGLRGEALLLFFTRKVVTAGVEGGAAGRRLQRGELQAAEGRPPRCPRHEAWPPAGRTSSH